MAARPGAPQVAAGRQAGQVRREAGQINKAEAGAHESGGRHGAVSDRPRGSGAVTDKLHVLKGHAGAACFADAVLNDACFNDLDDDDDDGSYLSGEGCYGPLQKRVGDAGIAFLRDLVPGTVEGPRSAPNLSDGKNDPRRRDQELSLIHI